MPFNGTCGVWRRAAIDDASGWQGDTLTEDLDLSLRARLRGWHPAYLNDLAVPGALPISAPAWRTQQFRWTKGFVQLIVAMFLSAGLLISNSRAGLEAIMGHHSEFVRTPKTPHTGPIQGRGRSYGVIEIAAGLSILGFALVQQIWSALYLTLVIGGLLSLGLMLAFDGRDLRRLVRMESGADA